MLKDVVFRVAPIDEQEAINMVESIKTIKLLKGVRGEKPSDLKAIADSLSGCHSFGRLSRDKRI